MYVVSQRQIIIYENIAVATNYYALIKNEKGVLTEGSVDVSAEG